MKHLKKLLFGLLAAVLLACNVFAAAVNLPDPDPDLLYVTDEAGILSAETENYIANKNDALFAANGAQVAVLTVNTLPSGYDSESYAYAVFNKWGVGSAEKNNGILILLVPDDGKFWIAVGYGLENTFTGGVCDDLLNDYLADDFDAGRYDKGIIALFDAIYGKLEGIYGTVPELDTGIVDDGEGYTGNNEGYAGNNNGASETKTGFFAGLWQFVKGVILLPLIIIVAIIILLGIIFGSGRRRYRNPPPPSGPYYNNYYNNSRPYYGGKPYGTTPPPPPPAGGFNSHRQSGNSRPSSSRPSSGGSSFGGGRASGGSGFRSGGSSRSGSFSRGSSFGGGRSHGGGGGRR